MFILLNLIIPIFFKLIKRCFISNIESGVEKTSIILQYSTNKFDPDIVSSLSAQFLSKTGEFLNVQRAIKFDIWDTAGQEKYRSSKNFL